MWKLILVLVLILYLLNKVAVIFFRIGRHQQPPPFQRRPDEEVHVDNHGKQTPRRGGIKGGEYVDYEEVK